MLHWGDENTPKACPKASCEQQWLFWLMSESNLRLPNDQIKEQLRVLLTGKQLSIPSICQHLRIARSRFAAFDKKNKGFLGSKGNGKATVYFLK